MQVVAVMGGLVGANGNIMGNMAQRFVIFHGQWLLDKFNAYLGADC